MVSCWNLNGKQNKIGKINTENATHLIPAQANGADNLKLL